MRKIILLGVTLLISLIVNAQSKMSKEGWQEDLRFLQSTIHKDYSFLFKKTSSNDFDRAVEQLYNDIPKMQEHEIIVGLSKLVASFKYGHTRLGHDYLPKSFHQLPVNVYQFNDGVFIQGVRNDYEKTLGAKVISIANVPIDEVMKAIYPVVPSENSQFFKAYLGLYINSPEVLHAQGIIKNLSDSVEFTLEKDGKIFKQIFKTLPDGERVPTKYGFVQQDSTWLDMRNQNTTPYYLKNLDKVYYFDYLPKQKAVYVRHSQIQDDATEDIPKFYQRLFEFIDNNDVERLIIDVRLNGGGDNTKNKPIITGLIKCDKINKVGKLFVIIGRRTFSAAQNLVNEISNYTNAIFVGEPTGENINFYGDPIAVILPNSRVPIYLSFAWWQDKAPWDGGEWSTPNIAVDMSSEDYKSNKDLVLDAALSFSDTNYILNPMEYISELFFQGKLDEVKSETAKMIKDPKYRYVDFEYELHKAGHQLLRSKLTQEAVFVMEMITELFPNSISAWYNLAEVYLKTGDYDKALVNYNKVLKMDVGDAKRNLVKEKIEQINND